MEQFGIPLREIGEKFTKSEIVLIAWRSQEQHHYFKKRMKKLDKGDDISDERQVTSGKRRKQYADGIGPERMPDEFFDENGDFNLSKVEGEKARRYFEQVLRIPMPPGISKMGADDDRTREIKQAYGIRR